jgi:small-conductance mechanosensitive channel
MFDRRLHAYVTLEGLMMAADEVEDSQADDLRDALDVLYRALTEEQTAWLRGRTARGNELRRQDAAEAFAAWCNPHKILSHADY